MCEVWVYVCVYVWGVDVRGVCVSVGVCVVCVCGGVSVCMCVVWCACVCVLCVCEVWLECLCV